MAVTPGYREFVLEQLGRVGPVTHRAMFGGVGIYSEGLFFGLMDDDRLYFKVDDSNRPRFKELGMGPFTPYGEGSRPMSYYEVPADVLEDTTNLTVWMDAAVDVARRARRK